jgi:hypothetical protein
MTTRLFLAAGALLIALGATAVGATAHRVYSDSHCGGPPAGWTPKKPYELRGNVLSIGRRQSKWNGYPLTKEALKRLLSQAAHLSPSAPLHVVINGNVDCSDALAIRRDVDQFLRCGSDQQCHEYSDAEWKRAFPQPLHR